MSQGPTELSILDGYDMNDPDSELQINDRAVHLGQHVELCQEGPDNHIVRQAAPAEAKEWLVWSMMSLGFRV